MKSLNREKLTGAMKAFAYSKPGFELLNYSSETSYKSDYRHYKKDADFNREKMKYIDLINDGLTDDEIRYCFEHSFSGRLSIADDGESLNYCTGQYYPTEYQAALRAVIECMYRKIDQKLIDINPPEEKTTFSNITEIKEHNKVNGFNFFNRDTMQFFNSKIESSVLHGCYFITSEVNPSGEKRFSIRKAKSNGNIKTIGDFHRYGTKESAINALEKYLTFEKV